MDVSVQPAPKASRSSRSAVLNIASKLKRGTGANEKQNVSSPLAAARMPLLPPDHPHSQQRMLTEISPNETNDRGRPLSADGGGKRPLQKRSKSHISLRSLGRSKKEQDDSDARSGSRPRSRPHERDDLSGNRSRSTAALTSLFKAKSRGEEHDHGSSDKENFAPLEQQRSPPVLDTPIYAQFAKTRQESTSSLKVPINDRKKKQTLIEQIALYDPDSKRMDESKQRNFHGYDGGLRAVRPKSEVISGHELGRFLDRHDWGRKSGDGRRPKSHVEDVAAGAESSKCAVAHSRPSSGSRTEQVLPPTKPKETNSGRSLVKDAVARINRRAKTAEKDSTDLKKFAADFDAMLEARNIPDMVRKQMRVLDQHVKQALLKSYEQDQELARRGSAGSDAASSPSGSASGSRPNTQGEVTDGVASKHSSLSKKEDARREEKSESKKTRPRSRTFTFKRSDKNDRGNASSSPTKKQKTDLTLTVNTNRMSVHDPVSPATMLSTSPATPSGSYFSGFSKKNVPEDYVKHLQKHREPKDLEVGKLHKLRQLLRNETLPWVHKFIELGGMQQIVDLLHRLMDIEWREERDDQLMTEALLCLKGLCTTDLALQKLCEIEATLFPALLAMLFDKEHRGPSEFATRQIVFNILLVHLESAVRVPDILPFRANTILTYLADQEPAEKRNRLPFDVEVGPKRPYKIWHREVSNVTKEVFWVWLHQLNVIPYPELEVQVESTGCITPDKRHPTVRKCPPARDLTSEAYLREFFPRPRPPVPAAPYIGGVEWDATNYLASHIDLLNGLIAALPTREERNALRAELRASGFERTMGGKMRQCKEKYYGAVHDVLRTWVGAGCADGWAVGDVRMGAPREDSASPSKKSPRKGKSPVKRGDNTPQLARPPMLELDLGLGSGDGEVVKVGGHRERGDASTKMQKRGGSAERVEGKAASQQGGPAGAGNVDAWL